MRKFQRVNQPAFLVDRWEAWGVDWERRRSKNPSAKFNWPQFKGKPLNELLLPPLKEQTQEHCSFCDSFPVSPPSDDTIEHFRPKSSFPREACRWENLYFCCRHCQRKFEEFDEALLRPDADDYDFDQYFRWDYTQGTIEINEHASVENRNYSASWGARASRPHPSASRRRNFPLHLNSYGKSKAGGSDHPALPT
jgi:uncharacterized protein (TIGR02646 family)